MSLELLSPAGSYEGFLAAMSSGADAVYAGGRQFGARAYAANFSDEELIKAIDTAHLLGKKFYLTVNTLCKERELKDLISFLAPLYDCGLDAVIVQDIGLINLIRELFPLMEVHASTQMTLTSVMGAKYLKSLGATRIVPARELSLDEIKLIHKDCDIEIEAFIHGAMCYSYSGQCLMSSFLGGRSGNRGRCAQPCRLSYDAYCDSKVISRKNENYILSMKDLCTLKNLPDLIDAGIISFKIEGRMKKPEYTGFVTSIYRKYLDLYLEKGRKGYEVNNIDYENLINAYKRSEAKTGYYYIHNSRDLITLKKPSYESEVSAAIINRNSQSIPVNGYVYLAPNNESILTFSSGDYSVSVTGGICQTAQNRPLLEEDIIKQLSKTGESIFNIEDLHVDMTDDVFLPVSSLNELRRQAIIALSDEMLSKFKRTSTASLIRHQESIEEGNEKTSNLSDNRNISVLVNTHSQLEAICKVIENNTTIKRIYIDSSCVLKDADSYRRCSDILKKSNIEIFIALPYIFRNKTQKIIELFINENSWFIDSFKGFLIRNYEELYWSNSLYPNKTVWSDYNLYTFNSYACRKLSDSSVSGFTYPLELNRHEMLERGYKASSELFIYGRIPMMISAGCVMKTTNVCQKGHSHHIHLKDRYDKNFPVLCDCLFCYNRILNSVPLVLNDKDINKFGQSFAYCRYEFTTESYDEVISILQNKEYNNEFTKGHFKNSVE